MDGRGWATLGTVSGLQQVSSELAIAQSIRVSSGNDLHRFIRALEKEIEKQVKAVREMVLLYSKTINRTILGSIDTHTLKGDSERYV